MAAPRFLTLIMEVSLHLVDIAPELAPLMRPAVELAISGGVVPVVTTGAALVRSDEPGIWLVVDGECQCGQDRRPQVCVHTVAWRLYSLALMRMGQEEEEVS